MTRMEWYYLRKARGVCVTCGEAKPIKGSVRCLLCLYARRRYQRQLTGAQPWSGHGRKPLAPDPVGS